MHAENGKKWTFREELLVDILPAIANAGEEDDFAQNLFISLQSNAGLRQKIMANRGHNLIAQKMILGYVPDKAKPALRKFIAELLMQGEHANC